jgi:hypothetical protein
MPEHFVSIAERWEFCALREKRCAISEQGAAAAKCSCGRESLGRVGVAAWRGRLGVGLEFTARGKGAAKGRGASRLSFLSWLKPRPTKNCRMTARFGLGAVVWVAGLSSTACGKIRPTKMLGVRFASRLRVRGTLNGHGLPAAGRHAARLQFVW